MEKTGEVIAILVAPAEYLRHVNEVASVTTLHIRVLKKKNWTIGSDPYHLIEHRIADCERLDYEDRRSVARIVFGSVLAVLICVIFVLLGIYWDSLQPGSRIPVGFLALAFFIGLRWVFGSRVHRLVFLMRDGARLSWKSRAGEFHDMQRAVDNILAFAKSRGLLTH